MPEDTKTLGYNKALACESRGFVHKKEGALFDTPPPYCDTAKKQILMIYFLPSSFSFKAANASMSPKVVEAA